MYIVYIIWWDIPYLNNMWSYIFIRKKRVVKRSCIYHLMMETSLETGYFGSWSSWPAWGCWFTRSWTGCSTSSVTQSRSMSRWTTTAPSYSPLSRSATKTDSSKLQNIRLQDRLKSKFVRRLNLKYWKRKDFYGLLKIFSPLHSISYTCNFSYPFMTNKEFISN